MSYKLILLCLFGLLALAAANPWPLQKVSDATDLGDTSDEMTEDKPQEESDEKDKRAARDVLATSCCRYLKNKGYLSRNANLRKLCYATLNCKDILSKQCCRKVKARNECSKDSRLSRIYCEFTCNKCGRPICKVSVPLGMQSKAIPDSKITASSISPNSRYYRHNPYYARLHMNAIGWAAKVNRVGQWLQVDLSKVTTITGIATQGRRTSFRQWVKSYSLQYSLDGRTFHKYQAGKIFAANVDMNSVVKHDLNPPIRARYIRVYPKTWYSHITMRMELYGCK